MFRGNVTEYVHLLRLMGWTCWGVAHSIVRSYEWVCR